MKQFLLSLLFLILFSFANAGGKDVEVIDDTIYSKGIPVAILETVKLGMGNYDFRLKNLMGDELIYFKLNSYNKPSTLPNGPATVIEQFYECLFLETKQIAEIGSTELGMSMVSKTKTLNKIASLILENRLISNNTLGQKAVDNFIFKLGLKYSVERERILSPKGTTIIINN